MSELRPIDTHKMRINGDGDPYCSYCGEAEMECINHPCEDNPHTPPSAAPEGAPREGTPERPEAFFMYDHNGKQSVMDAAEAKEYIEYLESALRAVTEERDRALREEWNGAIEAAACRAVSCKQGTTAARLIRALAKHPAPATPRKDGD